MGSSIHFDLSGAAPYADELRMRLTEAGSRGVVFERYDIPGLKMENDISTGGGAKTAWFKDPDGNILATSQRI